MIYYYRQQYAIMLVEGLFILYYLRWLRLL